MGTFCSKIGEEDYTIQQHEKQSGDSHSKLHKKLHPRYRGGKMVGVEPPGSTVVRLDLGDYVKTRDTRLDSTMPNSPLIYDVEEDYEKDRAEIMRRGHSLAFDHRLTLEAGDEERAASARLEIVKWNDKVAFYDAAAPLEGFGGQRHERFPGDHFLSNADLLEQTGLFKMARVMPKGAHLHIHFNACLLPHVLLDIAETMDSMYISSSLPLVSEKNLNICEIQFLIRNIQKVKKERAELLEKEMQTSRPDVTLEELKAKFCNERNLLHRDYKHTEGRQGEWMEYKLFIKQWEKASIDWKSDAQMEKFANVTSKSWLTSKLVFSEQEAHHPQQTVHGAWEKFNGRTRMMKGLFNYTKAFREYTRRCLDDFARDGIQYAEIRPNFMQANQIWKDDGSDRINNEGTMDIIVEEWDRFNREKPHVLFGLKVIYCTPRSFAPEAVEVALAECLEFKLNKYHNYIAGFDLVGEESKGNPLKCFIPQFLEFKRECRKKGVEIPFLFHCGETLDTGGETDANLVDALLLDSKRIGHGFALSRKPYIISEFKKRNVCLEICPISNEVLGLTPRMNGHAVYDLLANDVHCTINSDNGTIFRSTLSHDFYQVMVGSQGMNLHGWRQLIEWSIEHASLDKEERRRFLEDFWKPRWDDFIQWVNEEFRDVRRINPVASEDISQGKDESRQNWETRKLADDSRIESEKSRFEAQKAQWRNRIGALEPAL